MINPNALPFLSGRNAFVERIAQLDEWMRFDPTAMLLNQGQTDANWTEIRQAAFSALEAAGNEVASARTSADAAVATLRRDTYFNGLKDIDVVLLKIGKSLLQAGPTPAPLKSGYVGFVAYGRKAIGGRLEQIPATHWEAGKIDWENWRLELCDGKLWIGVRILDLASVQREIADEIVEIFDSAVSPIDHDAITISAPGDAPTKRVSYTTMARFLASHIDRLPAGDLGLSEAALWMACKERFARAAPSREMLREWIRKDMSPAKRKRRGDRGR